MKEIYKDFSDNVIVLNRISSEMVKYASMSAKKLIYDSIGN